MDARPVFRRRVLVCLSRTATTAEADEETECQRRTNAHNRTLEGKVAGDIDQVAQFPFNLVELFPALFLDVPGQILELAFGSRGMDKSRAAEIVDRIGRGLFKTRDILLSGRKGGSWSLIGHSASLLHWACHFRQEAST